MGQAAALRRAQLLFGFGVFWSSGRGHGLAQFGEGFAVPEGDGEAAEEGRSGDQKAGLQQVEPLWRGGNRRIWGLRGVVHRMHA